MVKNITKTTVGLETEFFTINSEGTLVDTSDKLFSSLEKNNKKLFNHAHHEFALSMFEFISDPADSVPQLSKNYLENLRGVVEIGEREGIHLLPLASYPGKTNSKIRPKKWYAGLSAVFGKKTYNISKRFVVFISTTLFQKELLKNLLKK